MKSAESYSNHNKWTTKNHLISKTKEKTMNFPSGTSIKHGSSMKNTYHAAQNQGCAYYASMKLWKQLTIKVTTF